MKNLRRKFKKMKDSGELNEIIEKNREEAKIHNLGCSEDSAILAFYLHNSHNTISDIASGLSNLSKSTYPTDIYIEGIREYQKEMHRSIIVDDIKDILNYDIDSEEALEEIRQYIENLNKK